jgi:UDP-N-acetylmuramyl pentapeptide phosphotransferase/UDP-N-acetylglucosamine-1-phosphate transferase
MDFLNVPELWPLAAAVTALAITACATAWLLPWLIARQLVDAPNARSSHTTPKPRGAGPAIVLGIIIACLVFGPVDTRSLGLGLAALVLCALGFLDDRRSLSARLRLLVQAMITAALVALIPPDMQIARDYLPFWLERGLIWLSWIWIINLTNFMDGIDGICGVQMVSVGGGIALAGSVLWGADGLTIWAAALAGSGLGFLIWNWPPSRLFMGDSGSLPLGLISGALSIELALRGYAPTAILLNGLFWSDATLTLLRRVVKGEPIWQAHRSHTYQRLAAGLGTPGALDHRRTLWAMIVLNAWLFLFAIEALDQTRAVPAMLLGLGLLIGYHLTVERLNPMYQRST